MISTHLTYRLALFKLGRRSQPIGKRQMCGLPFRLTGPRPQPSDHGGNNSLKAVLDIDASRVLREVFLKEIAILNSADAALAWACKTLAAKNTLTFEDASIVDAAFRDRIQVLEPELLLSKSMEPETRQSSTEIKNGAEATDTRPPSRPI